MDTETVVVIQDKAYQAAYLAPAGEAGELRQVRGLHELTPYGMLLAALGSCTADVLIAYANHHGVPLEQVELKLEYRRSYRQDCENCEGTDRYEEEILLEPAFEGERLLPADREKLTRIARQCPIHKMLKRGIAVDLRAPEPASAAGS